MSAEEAPYYFPCMLKSGIVPVRVRLFFSFAPSENTDFFYDEDICIERRYLAICCGCEMLGTRRKKEPGLPPAFLSAYDLRVPSFITISAFARMQRGISIEITGP